MYCGLIQLQSFGEFVDSKFLLLIHPVVSLNNLYFCFMTTITIKNGAKLSRDTFENWDDFQRELILMQESFKLTDEHKEILESREKEADLAEEPGLTWERVKKNISRKNV